MNTNEIVIVTSFNEAIFQHSGNAMLLSVMKHLDLNKIRFIIFYEGSFSIQIHSDFIENFEFVNASRYKFLMNWLQENIDVIPKCYGGLHSNRMPYFQKNSSKFFRKVAALKYAYDKYSDAKKIIWMDADMVILKDIDHNFFSTVFNDRYACYYLYGKYRRGLNKHLHVELQKGVESCLLVFNKPFSILSEWIDAYKDKQFRRYRRWDDGWVLAEILEHSIHSSYDFGGPADNPLRATKLCGWFRHHKGRHQEKGIHLY